MDRGGRRFRSSLLLEYLLTIAPDHVASGEELLTRHGEALKRWAPRQFFGIHRFLGLHCFMTGDKRRATRYLLKYLRHYPSDLAAWGILSAGMLGPSATTRANLWKRRHAR